MRSAERIESSLPLDGLHSSARHFVSGVLHDQRGGWKLLIIRGQSLPHHQNAVNIRGSGVIRDGQQTFRGGVPGYGLMRADFGVLWGSQLLSAYVARQKCITSLSLYEGCRCCSCCHVRELSPNHNTPATFAGRIAKRARDIRVYLPHSSNRRGLGCQLEGRIGSIRTTLVPRFRMTERYP
jgi:hypothetical protein